MAEQNNSNTTGYFIPEQKQDDFDLTTLPEEVSVPVESADLAAFSLKPRKIRFLKPLAILLGLMLLVVAGWEMVRFVTSMMAIHALLGWLAAAVLLTLLVLFLLALRSYRNNMSELASVNRFQDKSRKLMDEEKFGGSGKFIDGLKKLYEDKPHEALLTKTITTLPDYSGDREALEHLSSHFFGSLDARAIEIVSRYSKQAGLLVAISPLAIADMVLSIWRTLKMVDEIAQVYGLRPSLPGRIRLLRKLLNTMALAGVTDLATDMVADYSSASVAGIVSTRLGQGIGVGLYIARVGIYTMDLCRPIPFNDANRPKLKDVLVTLKPFIKDQLKDAVTA